MHRTPHHCLKPLAWALHWAFAGFAVLPGAALAQNASPPGTANNATDLGQVEVRGNRNNDTEMRRESSAAKIVIGREEIQKQGDANLGEVLKRLPGVTVQGAPGRGGAIRMRGLGGGYTQILLDGERLPPGFSIDSLLPEQVERIEILRAPTAETGARAIAGTINIVLREGQKANPDDLKITRSREYGHDSTLINWVHNLDIKPLTGTLTMSVTDQYRPDASSTVISSNVLGDSTRSNESLGRRQAMHANARLQWKGEQGKTLTLTPFVVYSDFAGNGLIQANRLDPLASETAQTLNQSRFAMARLNGQWAQRLSADDRLEVRFGVGQSEYDLRLDQTLTTQSATPPLLLNNTQFQNFVDRSGTLSSKWTRAMDNGHQVVSGLELEGVRRSEEARGLLDDNAGDLTASTLRWAAYAQDEFKINRHWSAHTGLRYETITTEANATSGLKSNTSSVWTPLLHALWKPDPAKRDQVRMSLTRSYRTPTLHNLMARPVSSGEVISRPTRPDRIGNPDLRPELATGIDVAFERYLAGGGVLSANVFRREITDLIRYTVTQQNGRFVSSPINIGDASTQGLELEAKFRLNQAFTDALPIDIRSNVSFFGSNVKQVPGPNNRLDQQPDMTANLGADYRIRRIPLTLGGNLNWNPDYDTRRTEQQFFYQGVKRVVDVYGLWRISPASAIRLTVSNLQPRDYITASTFDNGTFTEASRTTDRNWRNVQLRLEMKI
jgi:outer membrane receptor for ferrienterochelin and colicins